ncbi:hypothetical protein ACQJBY_059993 [Aegilops geniculata]
MHPRLPYSDDGWAEAPPGPIRRWPWLHVSSRSGFARVPRSPCGTCKRVKTLATSSSRQARTPSASSPPCPLLSHDAALEPAPPTPRLLLSNAAALGAVRDAVDMSGIRRDEAQPEHSRNPLLTLLAQLTRAGQRIGSRAPWPRRRCHLDSLAVAWSCPGRRLESPPSPPRATSVAAASQLHRCRQESRPGKENSQGFD